MGSKLNSNWYTSFENYNCWRHRHILRSSISSVQRDGFSYQFRHFGYYIKKVSIFICPQLKNKIQGIISYVFVLNSNSEQCHWHFCGFVWVHCFFFFRFLLSIFNFPLVLCGPLFSIHLTSRSTFICISIYLSDIKGIDVFIILTMNATLWTAIKRVYIFTCEEMLKDHIFLYSIENEKFIAFSYDLFYLFRNFLSTNPNRIKSHTKYKFWFGLYLTVPFARFLSNLVFSWLLSVNQSNGYSFLEKSLFNWLWHDQNNADYFPISSLCK